jgi:hypothetical protein
VCRASVVSEPGHTQVLRAIGTGGFWGGILLAIAFWHPAWLLLSLVLFVGTAVVDGIITAVEARKARD